MSFELRPVSIELDPSPYAEGSCVFQAGATRILCTASVTDELPRWREASGLGWVTAEYAMLPRATHTRNPRERTGPRGRTQEIQRLIGRSLRSVVDFEAMGPLSVTVDCDVLQADGGTRTASVTGGAIALARAFQRLRAEGRIPGNPMRELVAAVSVGMVDGAPSLDLDYDRDSRADVDMNVVATEGGRLVEVQGTAEGAPFLRSDLDALLDRALSGIRTLVELQRGALAQGE